MPQIPQSTIDKIRDQADIVDVISREVELKRKGVNYFGICPFHDENTPSSVFRNQNRFINALAVVMPVVMFLLL